MSMTIAQLKQELTAHGVPLPESSARKEIYERLYQEHVAQPKLKNQKKLGVGNGADNFSSDDDEGPHNGNGLSGNGSIGNGDDTEVPLDPAVVAEVDKLSNEELYNALKSQGQYIGPVVASTRQMYKKRLVRLSIGRDTTVEDVPMRHESEVPVNGHTESVVHNMPSRSQLSSDEEMETPEMNSEEPEIVTESGCLTAEQKHKLEQLMSPSYYSSSVSASHDETWESDPKPKKSKLKNRNSERTVSPTGHGGLSMKVWIIGILVVLFAIYIAYEIYEDSRSTEADPKPTVD